MRPSTSIVTSARSLATTAVLLAVPSIAAACPVCGLASGGGNEWAYTAMSAILSVLPLGMMIGGSVWLYRRVKQREGGIETPPTAPGATRRE
jgi:hypothetical protein